MQQHAIARISLGIALLGVVFLFALSHVFEARETSIEEISREMVAGQVIVKGRIETAFRKEGFALFELNDGTGQIKAVAFNLGEEEEQLIEKNRFVEVQGKVQLYREELQIVAEKVREWQ